MREPGAEDLLEDGMKEWPDNPKSAWYYEAIQEATNAHEYDRQPGENTGNETWVQLVESKDWKTLEAEWAANNGAFAKD